MILEMVLAMILAVGRSAAQPPAEWTSLFFRLGRHGHRRFKSSAVQGIWEGRVAVSRATTGTEHRTGGLKWRLTARPFRGAEGRSAR